MHLFQSPMVLKFIKISLLLLLQKRRLFGQVVTANNALPAFSGASLTPLNLKDRRPNKGEMATILAECKAHLKSIIGCEYPKPSEYATFASKMVHEYPILADADNPIGFVSTLRAANHLKL